MVGRRFPKDYQKGKPLLSVEITTTRPDRTWKAAARGKRLVGPQLAEMDLRGAGRGKFPAEPTGDF